MDRLRAGDNPPRADADRSMIARRPLIRPLTGGRARVMRAQGATFKAASAKAP